MPAIAVAGAVSASALSGASPPITTSWRLPLEPSMMVTVLFSPAAACLGADFAACSAWPEARCGRLLVRRRRLAQGDVRDRLAAKGIVREQGDGGKADQEQAEQHGQRLHRGERQPKPALLALGFLSERRAQLVGRFRHEPPRINRAEDTTMDRIRALATRSKAVHPGCAGR